MSGHFFLSSFICHEIRRIRKTTASSTKEECLLFINVAADILNLEITLKY